MKKDINMKEKKNFAVKKYSAVTIMLFFLAAAAEALDGIYLGKIVDAIGQKDVYGLSICLAVSFVLAIASEGGYTLAQRGMYKNACAHVQRLKDRIFCGQLLRRREEEADFADFTSKIDLLYNDYFLSRQYIIMHGAIFLCASAAIISVNWLMFLVAVTTSLVPFIVPVLFKKKVQAAAERYAEGSTAYAGSVADMLRGRLEIMKYQAAGAYIRRHSGENAEFEQKRLGNLQMNNVAEKTADCIAELMYIAVLIAGGILVAKDVITVGNVLSVVQLMNSTVFPVTAMVGYKNKMNSCKPVLEALEAEGAEAGALTAGQQESLSTDIPRKTGERKSAELRAERLTFAYDDGEPVISNFSYLFEPGKKYLIRGESGCGKTTLARLLCGELSAVSGRVLADGREISPMASAEGAGLVNYVDQKSWLFQDTVKNNITLYREYAEEEKIAAQMEAFRLRDISLDTVVSDGSGLSGGQRSRICLLRALVDMPQILIVDEPTAALDRSNSKNVIRYLCQMPETVIVIAHNLDQDTEALFDGIIKM